MLFYCKYSDRLFTRSAARNAVSAVFIRKSWPLSLWNRPKSSLEKKDSVPVPVYYGALTPHIRRVKAFSLMTSAAGLIAQPILYQQVTSYGGGMPLTIALGSVVGFFTFVTPFLLHLITRKYVTEIRYNAFEDNYDATLLTFFLRQQRIKFCPSDVEVPDIPGMFTSFHIKGRPVFVDPRLFPDPLHYAKIMGYDKPLDFTLDESDKKTKQSQ